MKEILILSSVDETFQTDQFYQYKYLNTSINSLKMPHGLVFKEVMDGNRLRFESQLYYDRVAFSEIGEGRIVSVYDGRNKLGEFRVESRFFVPVEKSDWGELKELNLKESEILDIQLEFTAKEFDHLKLGLKPIRMEDKWFVYVKDSVIHFHRSWSGIEVYRAEIKDKRDGGFVINSVFSDSNFLSLKEERISLFKDLVKYRIVAVKRMME